MCKKCCEMGSRECEVPLITFGGRDRSKLVYIDRCMTPEICWLWNNGVDTIACCCGHHITEPTILVDSTFLDRMTELGYDKPTKIDEESGFLSYSANTMVEKY